MFEKSENVKKSFKERIEQAKRPADLEQMRIDFLGKKGQIAELMSELRNVPNEKKKEAGQRINEIKQTIESEIQKRTAELIKAEELLQVQMAEAYDESMPIGINAGSYHPITLVQREVEEIFRTMGFAVEDYYEITDDYNCFEALNIPKHHPARDMQDTYYLSTGQLLKTQTSAAQNMILKKYKKDLEAGMPLRAIFPGRCFRNEKIDACHENTFFQMEGMMVDKDISISNLIYFMKTML
ncbi:MAG: phenylalanine--tRNA ligase subunit alpha, partial [Clostridia bacterium]|nr:phenylalanine--tRNA ligase subunit alpha [Clostridia bacterium]